jgi:hypothetical protein
LRLSTDLLLVAGAPDEIIVGELTVMVGIDFLKHHLLFLL